jgi:hypothetical protein
MQDGDDEERRRRRRKVEMERKGRERDNSRRGVGAALLDVAECAVVIHSYFHTFIHIFYYE